ncbi:hypothetical protein [Pseudoalteromonas lipolytica]|uniref:hypothetical protein n=1 Tax=Pseudoalteromonas lipolytica TaxID=570156 RepID=UPI000825E114|nr:hypothetical protein [Pseudoalteromonas lipolytica]
MESKYWEVGSDFNAVSGNLFNFEAWYPNALFLASGRSPMLLLKELIDERVLYCPDYFCWDVIEYWKAHGIKTQSYRVFFEDNRIKVDFSTVPTTGAILAVNFFGCDSGDLWKNFKSDNEVLLIEDHSHSPMSEWAKSSNADFAFSSLRKTLPIPDGCILWSPNNKEIPRINSMQPFDSRLKLEAMKLKSQYLEGTEVDKNIFLELFTAGEKLLASSEPHFISDISYKQFSDGYPIEYMNIRKSNQQLFIANLDELTCSNVELLHFPCSAVPFGAVLKCSTPEIRTRLRDYLVINKVYCPVHWPQKEGYVSPESLSLSEQIITIPIDQRYSLKDVELVAQLINRFFENE